MNILVTGCAGYIGSKLCYHLINNTEHTVIGVDNLFYGQKEVLNSLWGNCKNKFKFHHLDTYKGLDKVQELAKECDVVIPLAALVGESICDKHALLAHQVNYDAVAGLVYSLNKGQKVLYPMTTSSYGITDGETEITEGHEQHPISLYGDTKKKAEKVVLEYGNSVSLRLATVYGNSIRPRYDLLVNHFTYELVKNKKLTIFEGHYVRSIVDIIDIVRVFDFFIDNNIKGIFNVSSESLSKWDIAEKICKTLRLYSAKIYPGEGKDKDQRNYNISQKRLLNTGFRFRASFDDTLRELSDNIAWGGIYERAESSYGKGRNI